MNGSNLRVPSLLMSLCLFVSLSLSLSLSLCVSVCLSDFGSHKIRADARCLHAPSFGLTHLAFPPWPIRRAVQYYAAFPDSPGGHRGPASVWPRAGEDRHHQGQPASSGDGDGPVCVGPDSHTHTHTLSLSRASGPCSDSTLPRPLLSHRHTCRSVAHMFGVRQVGHLADPINGDPRFAACVSPRAGSLWGPAVVLCLSCHALSCPVLCHASLALAWLFVAHLRCVVC
jgi:hypothetical protein